ncbi:MAG: hypothetical protein M1812_005417 [Candelaria pacifica]|nr:MAG: hypothetical protein M1812_005417 [Candelaria pacifica]
MDDNSSLPSTTATFPLWDGWNHDPLLNSTLAPGGLHSSSQYQEPSPVFDGCASPNNLTQVTPVNQSDNNVLWGNEVLSMVEQPLFVHDVYPAQGWIQDGPSGSAGMQGMLAPFHYEAFVNGVAPSEIIAPSTAIQERGFSHPTINDTGLVAFTHCTDEAYPYKSPA